jgi:ElaA protein
MTAGVDAALPIVWKLSAFEALSVRELHDVLQLRSEVFVLEQRCVFQDIDGSDAQAMHLMGHRDGQLLAYARCFPAAVKFVEASIGRVVTRRHARGSGLGHLLIERALSSVCTLWGVQSIRIGAQTHLEKYYCGHGFVDAGKPYIEDGIDHLEMVWRP